MRSSALVTLNNACCYAGSNAKKRFYGHNLPMFVIGLSFCPWQTILACLLIKQEPTLLKNHSGAPLKGSLAHKQLTRLERLFRDKYSSLLQKLVNNGQKSFKTLHPEFHQCIFIVIQKVIMLSVIMLSVVTQNVVVLSVVMLNVAAPCPAADGRNN
jgi:hypothetical protein